jgi:hypothetical protein
MDCFSVTLPVAGIPHQLGTSRHAAEMRLLAIERTGKRSKTEGGVSSLHEGI